jgi:hypothetical protein
MSVERVTYLDSSAIVRLVAREEESTALRRFLHRRRPLVSSALARAEVGRAVLSLGEPAFRQAREVLARIELVRVNDEVLAAAGALLPVGLRTLDAIHLATAGLFADTLARIVSYDGRVTSAATAMGWRVDAPT